MPGETAHAADAAPPPARSRTSLRIRAWPALAATAILTLVLAGMAFADGGYFPSAYTSAGAVAFVALAVLFAVAATVRFSRRALLAIGCLAGYGAWIALSRLWSPVPYAGVLDMQRALLYLALFTLGLLAADSGRHGRVLVWSVLGVVVAIAGAGLLSRLQPDLIEVASADASLAGYRLDYPLHYWNAFGAMASLGAVLAAGLAADPRAHTVLRAIGSGTCVLLVVAMYLSLSRGAWLALIIGLVVLVAIAPHRGSVLLVLLVAGCASAVVIARVQTYPALVTDPGAGSGQVAQGDAFTRELLALVVLAAVAQAALALGRMPSAWRRRGQAIRGPLRVGGAALAAVVVLGVGLVAGGAGPVNDAGGWLDRQWQDFLDPAAAPGTGTARLLTTKGARSDPYRVALEGFREHPVAGGGAGSFEVRYMRDRRIDLKLRDVHSLPLQTLSELGAVGLLLLLGFVGAVAAAAWRALGGRAALRAPEAAAVTAAFTVWLAHACVDWDWEMPALTGTAVVLSAALFARHRRAPIQPDGGSAGLLSARARRSARGAHGDHAYAPPTMALRGGRPRRLRGRRRGRLLSLVVVAVVVGAALGVAIALLSRGGDDDTQATVPTAGGSATATPPSAAGLRVQVLGAVLRPAKTESRRRRRRARLSVRVRVDNGGLRTVTPARPRLLVDGVRVPTDPTADSPRTHFGAIAPGATAAVTLRFEVDGNTTTALTEERRAQLLIAGRTQGFSLKVGVSEPADETAAP